MSRFADWRARRRNAWRRTTPAARLRRELNGTVQAARLAPDTGSHLSDGVVVQTRLVARLLGLPVLRVDAVVQLAPARVEPADLATRPGHEPPLPLGADLARASRLLDDGDRRLEGADRYDTGLSSSPRVRAS
jgi:hypothetical protein